MPPLFKGGQGRDDKEIQDLAEDALIWVIGVVIVVVIYAAIFGLRGVQ